MLPPFLKQGDRIAIVSPASSIDPLRIDGAAETLSILGYRPVVMPHAKGMCGSFSGTTQERLADMTAALTEPDIKAILCSRGGYGAVHLLPELDRLPETAFGKWLIGFSDITALHALWARKGHASLHASMAKVFAGARCHGGCITEAPTAGLTEELDLLRGLTSRIELASKTNPDGIENQPGEARGIVLGGNMAVLGGITGTRFDPLAAAARRGANFILLMEDIAEPIYKVERILYQLLLSGSLEKMAGIMVGNFTDYRPSRDHNSMEQMISSFLKRHFPAERAIPVAFGLGIGHTDEANYPIILNQEAKLRVTPGGATLTY